MIFLVNRIRACLDTRAFPYERRVCLWETEIIAACGLLGALLAIAPVLVSAWYVGLVWTWPALVLFGLPTAYGVHRGFWLGWFAWVDLGAGEAWRAIWFGAPYVPNISNETMEKFPGFKRGRAYTPQENDELETAWNRDKFRPLARWQGDPASGRYDVLEPEERTWAVRLHHRRVRPWLIRRGVPGYELAR